jgi:hypothetical protein
VPSACECRCRVGFTGQFCDKNIDTADRVINRERTVDINEIAHLNTTARPDITATPAPLAAEAAPVEEGSNNLLYIIIGASVGGLVLIGAGVWWFMGGQKKPGVGGGGDGAIDPLLAGMEGLDGLDLSNMDLSSLGPVTSSNI